MNIHVLGAGPTGMALVDGLGDGGKHKFKLHEKNSYPGGLATSLNWKNYGSHDLGPHKIFTLNKALQIKVLSLLSEDDWLSRHKVSSIYMGGHYLPYPPSPFSLTKVFGYAKFVSMTAGYGWARILFMLTKNDPKTFEEDLTGRLGLQLYEALFKPMALKLWGNPKALDVKLSKGRVQTPSLIEIISRLISKKSKSKFEALDFYYPKGGLQKIWDAISEKQKDNGEFCFKREIVKIEGGKQGIRKLVYKENGNESEVEIGENDFVASSLPLAELPRLFGDSLPEEIKNKIDNYVKLNDLLLVFLKIDKARLMNDSWVFVPDPQIAFHRLSEQESFDPGMSPDGSIVCCEIMSNETRANSDKNDATLIQLAKDGLASMGLDDFEIQDTKVIRLPRSYPVFKPDFEPVLEEILAWLDAIPNFKTIGRQGAFNYIGTLDAMDIGYGMAEWLNKGKQEDWRNERTRTRHFPVLD